MPRHETIPDDFLTHLQKTIPGFKRETPSCQYALARMIWISGTKYRKHLHFDEFMRFSYTELNGWFGRNQFKAVNERLDFFTVTDNWHFKLENSVRPDDNFTKGYQFTELVAASNKKYFNRRWVKATKPIILERGKIKEQNTSPPAFASTDTKGKASRMSRAAKESKELRHVPVDLVALQQLRKWLKYLSDEWEAGRAPHDLVTQCPTATDIERLHILTSKVIKMAKTDVAGHGYFAHHYTEAPSGRWYANNVNLQNSPSLIKEAALAGLWEYDFSNCHFDIIGQMAAQYGYQCEAIAHYLANKKVVRQTIADQAGITVRDAKVCLLAVMYGAKASTWHENAIPEEIGVEATKRLVEVDLFKEIYDDVAKAREIIVKSWPRTANGSLTNAYGKAISSKTTSGKKTTSEEKLAHLLQGAEAKALMVAINMYPNDLVLLQHDGFVATKKLHAPTISDEVFKVTGYRLELEESKIQVNPDAQFQKSLDQQNKNRLKRRSPMKKPIFKQTFAR